MSIVFAALLDTCVLWPSLQRDFLLSMAIEGLYRPLWSEAILDELELHEAYKLIDRGSEQHAAEASARRLLSMMRSAFDDAIVSGWEPLDGSYDLPDPDDEHVVAAAVVGGAGVIVTDNLKHFPTALVPGHIQVVSGKQFAVDTADVDPGLAGRALTAMSARRVRTPQTPRVLLDLLVERYGMDNLDEIIGPVLDEAGEARPAGAEKSSV